MACSENPLRRDYWLGDVDARGPALFRIGLGVVIVADLVDRLHDFHAFYTQAGLLPVEIAHRGGLRWSILFWSRSTTFAAAVFALAILVGVALALGFRTRLMTVLAWALMHSIDHRNLFVCDSGDSVIRVMCFWAMFADLGARFSLDVRLRRRPPQDWVPALPVRFLVIQIAVIYAFASWFKLLGMRWRDGTAIIRAVRGVDFGRPLGAALARAPRLCKALTWATLAVEGGEPLLLLSPFAVRWARGLAIVAAVALHGGILLTMRVGVFTVVMPVCFLLVVPPSWLDRLPRLERLGTEPPPQRARKWLAIFLATQMAVTVADQILVVTRHASPAILSNDLTLTGLWQWWSMFAPSPPDHYVKWGGEAAFTDGSKRPLLDAALPELKPDAGFWYSRWYKLRNNYADGLEHILIPFGSWTCRRYNQRSGGAKLDHFTLTLDSTWIPVGDEPVDPPHHDEVLTQDCGVAH